jgi:prolyl oligopeptidase
MTKILPLIAILAVLLQAPARWSYPPAKTTDATDTYFGRSYKDSYRWLENLKDKDVEAWFKAQADLTDGLLAKIPARDPLADEWMALDKLKPASYSQITYEHGRVFYKKSLGGENVGRLYFREGWKGSEQLLFDPAGFKPTGAKPGDVATIVGYTPSPDGRHLVLALSAAGAEYSELRPLEVDSRKLQPETIYPSYGALGWTMDSKSFFYDAGKVTDVKSPEIELNRKTRLHRLGTDVATDPDFFSNESYPRLGITPKEFPMASIDESYPAFVVGTVGTVQNEMRLFYAPSPEPQPTRGRKLEWSVLASPSDNLVRGIVFHKDHVYAVTHTGAPKYRIVRTLVAHPNWKTAETVVPQAKDSIQSITHSKSFLFVVYSDGIVGRLVKYGLDTGRISEVALPASGTIDISCPDFRTDQCIVFTTSWIQPTTLYDFDAEKDAFTKSIFNTAVSYPGFENLVTEEVEAPGHDGTMIPLSIIHRKDLKLDGSASAILEGYGAYGINYTPAFNVRHSIALHGVVLACHVRGGSKKERAWPEAG